jgi:membrane-associated phospholipid phosphatase
LLPEMKQLIKHIRVFNLLYLVFLISCSAILLLFSKAQIHLFINHYHSRVADIFFMIFTQVGNGLTPVFIGILLLLFSYRKALILGISTSLAGILSQICKNFIFPSEVRPKVFFDKIAELYFVPGVEVHSSHSFPSGHTTTAFCMFFVLAIFTTKNWLKVLCFIGAVLVGYSRMYLSQHFLVDVYFGSMIGMVSAMIIFLWIGRSNRSWMDKSIDLKLWRKR